MKIEVVNGDITMIQSDALITAINSGGMWFGGIDGAIQRVAGNHFHNQARERMPLRDSQCILARGGGFHRGKFNHVVFVVDDLQKPLREVIWNGLRVADEAGCKSVTLPTIRMGVMLGVVESSKQEAVTEMVEGIKLFLVGGCSLDSITFVVYNDTQTLEMLQRAIKDDPTHLPYGF